MFTPIAWSTPVASGAAMGTLLRSLGTLSLDETGTMETAEAAGHVRAITSSKAPIERAIEAGVFLLPLACWPDLDRPFSTPKVFVMIALAALACTRYFARTSTSGGGDWPWLAWPAAVALSALLSRNASPEALLLAVLPLPVCWAAREGHEPPERLERVLLISSLIESVLILLQYFYLDPFALLGWRPETLAEPRMRLFGTFGNPNFAAAWLCATLPLYLGVPWRGRMLPIAGAALQVAAILATGSRAAALAVPAAAVVLAWQNPRLRGWLPAAALLAVAVVWLSPGRPLASTIEGRLYYARVIAPHLASIPPAGYGPGSFEDRFAAWQSGWARTGGDMRFAGPLDHAHNDYLEIWVEYGPAGVAAFLGLLGWLAWGAWRSTATAETAGTAAWAAVAALGAVALVDFPFHRPAEWTLCWLLLGLVSRSTRREPNADS